MFGFLNFVCEAVPNRNSRPAILLREGCREGRKVCKRTFANLRDWPVAKIDKLRRVLPNSMAAARAGRWPIKWPSSKTASGSSASYLQGT